MSLPSVIVPVFNAWQDLQRCLASLEQHSPDANILLIDDASTDQRVWPLVRQFAAPNKNRQAQQNQTNLGFVATVNLAMQQLPGDVVLLNSDTQVTPDWLALLAACLASDARIATATPWSNNGEIVSVPTFCAAAPVPEDADRVARVIRQSGNPQYPEIPTAVGFCMAIARTALKQVGLFDADTFGRGYGEENDFCMRAHDAGFINVLCDNAYVAHTGGASFGPLGQAPDAASMARLLDKHPDYEQLVHQFILDDPLAPRRAALLHSLAQSGVAMG